MEGGEGRGRGKSEAYLTVTLKCSFTEAKTEVDRCIAVNIKYVKLPVKYGDLFYFYVPGGK